VVVENTAGGLRWTARDRGTMSSLVSVVGVVVDSAAVFEFSVPYLQRYLFNAISDTNHNANPTNPGIIQD